MYQWKKVWIPAAACVLALAVACSKSSEAPIAPSSAQPGVSEAAPDGSTLKVTTPGPQSPVNGQQPDGTLVLVTTPSTGKFANAGVLTYRFQVFNAGNTNVCEGLVTGGAGNVSFTPSNSGCQLAFDTPHTWRVRAESGSSAGPWSPAASFRSSVGGYMRGNELFDPLSRGASTVMTASRGVTWLPGVGVRLEDKDSYVEYRLPQTCVDCEMSALMTNIGNGSEEWKTKVLSMLQGNSLNITDNPYRVTLDKRTTWADQGSRIRFTMCSQKFDLHDDCAEPRGGFQNWNRAETYFWNFEWRHGTARLRVYRGGKNGQLIEDLTSEYDAPYAPNPHLVRLGSVGGRAGSDTNPGTIIWNIWVSPNSRPNLPGDK